MRSIFLFALLLLNIPVFAGSVTGTVVYEGRVPPLPAVDMSADPGCAKKHKEPAKSGLLVLGKGQTLGNVLVQLKGVAKRDHQAPTEPLIIDQQDCLYLPRVSAAMVGQQVLFKNSDGLMHNVHGLPEINPAFNLAMPPVVKQTTQTFNKPEEVFPVKCDVHPWMRAYVAVMTHPYFSVTGSDGRFEISGVPAGTYEVEVWHEKLGQLSQTVTVAKTGQATVDFALKVPGK